MIEGSIEKQKINLQLNERNKWINELRTKKYRINELMHARMNELIND